MENHYNDCTTNFQTFATSKAWACINTGQTATYGVTIQREPDFQYGDSWVARDDDGDWRAFSAFATAKTPAAAARGMFHADELSHLTTNDE